MVDGSSLTAEEIRSDAEVRKDVPKPRTFPVTAEAAGLGDGDRDRAPAKPKKPDSSLVSDFDVSP